LFPKNVQVFISVCIVNVKFLGKIYKKSTISILRSFNGEVCFRIHSWYADFIFGAGKADVFNILYYFCLSPSPIDKSFLTRIRKRSATSPRRHRGHVISGKGQRSRKSKGRKVLDVAGRY